MIERRFYKVTDEGTESILIKFPDSSEWKLKTVIVDSVGADGRGNHSEHPCNDCRSARTAAANMISSFLATGFREITSAETVQAASTPPTSSKLSESEIEMVIGICRADGSMKDLWQRLEQLVPDLAQRATVMRRLTQIASRRSVTTGNTAAPAAGAPIPTSQVFASNRTAQVDVDNQSQRIINLD